MDPFTEFDTESPVRKALAKANRPIRPNSTPAEVVMNAIAPDLESVAVALESLNRRLDLIERQG